MPLLTVLRGLGVELPLHFVDEMPIMDKQANTNRSRAPGAAITVRLKWFRRNRPGLRQVPGWPKHGTVRSSLVRTVFVVVQETGTLLGGFGVRGHERGPLKMADVHGMWATGLEDTGMFGEDKLGRVDRVLASFLLPPVMRIVAGDRVD